MRKEWKTDPTLTPAHPRRTEATLSLKLRNLPSAKLRVHRWLASVCWRKEWQQTIALCYTFSLFSSWAETDSEERAKWLLFSTCVKRLTKKSTEKAAASQRESVAVYLDVPPSGVLRSHLGTACAQCLPAVLISLLQKSPLLIGDTAV